MSLNEAEVVIIGLLAAEAIPAYPVASEACKGERLQRVEVTEICRGVAESAIRIPTGVAADLPCETR